MDGATLLAHFEAHDKVWPPYRIENNTDYNIKYTQLSQKGSSTFEKRNITIWDYMSPYSSVAYAWDHPVLGASVLRIEFERGGKDFRQDFNMDEMKPGKIHTIRLRKVLPKFDDASFIGDIRFSNGSTWIWYHCILKEANMYLFKKAPMASSTTENRDLFGIINVACSNYASKADVFQHNKKHTFLKGFCDLVVPA